jgi:hypothetical protein
MSNLPNSTDQTVRIFPNEYVNNQVVNRVHHRLLENDLYLEGLLGSATSGHITAINGLSGGGKMQDNPVIGLDINSLDEKLQANLVSNEMLAIYDPNDGTHKKITIGDLNSAGNGTQVLDNPWDGLYSNYGSNIYAIGLDYMNLKDPSCGGSVDISPSAYMAIYNDVEIENKHRKIHLTDIVEPIAQTLTAFISGDFLLKSPEYLTSFSKKTGTVINDYLLIEDSQAGNVKKYINTGDLSGQFLLRAPEYETSFAIKTNIVAGDHMLIEDSQAGNVKKYITVGDLIDAPIPPTGSFSGFLLRSPEYTTNFSNKAALNGNDHFLIEDSAASNVKKNVTMAAITGANVVVPGGSQYSIQYNNPAGHFAGDGNLTYDGSTLAVISNMHVSGDMIPGDNHNLGSPTHPWTNAYITNLSATNLFPAYIPLVGSNNIAGALIPYRDRIHDLGSVNYLWNDLFVDSIYSYSTDQVNYHQIYRNPGDNDDLYIYSTNTSQHGKIAISGAMTVPLNQAFVTLYDEFTGIAVPTDITLQCYSTGTSIIYDNIGISLSGTTGSDDTSIIVPTGNKYLVNMSFIYSGGDDCYVANLILYDATYGGIVPSRTGSSNAGSTVKVSLAQASSLFILDTTSASSGKYKLVFSHDDLGTSTFSVRITISLTKI